MSGDYDDPDYYTRAHLRIRTCKTVQGLEGLKLWVKITGENIGLTAAEREQLLAQIDLKIGTIKGRQS